MLAELAVSDPAAFTALVEVAKAALAEAGPDDAAKHRGGLTGLARQPRGAVACCQQAPS